MINKNSKQGVSRNIVNGLIVLALLCAAFVIGVKWTEFNISYFPIEKGNIRVFPLFTKTPEPSETVIFQIESFDENARIVNRYLLNYWFDPQKSSQVGFVFVFNKPINLSQFSYIRFKCVVEAPSIWIRVANTDKGVEDVVEINRGKYGLTEFDGEQQVSIPLSVFVNTDWKHVSVFNFYVDSDTTFKVASKRFAIEKIEFVNE